MVRIVGVPKSLEDFHDLLALAVAEHNRQVDRMRQAMANNLWDNNPHEIDRWADDGGRSDAKTT